MIDTTSHSSASRFPLLLLLHPRSHLRLFLALLLAGLLLAWLSVTRLRLPLWGATVLVLGLLLYPAVRKWREDGGQFGRPLMVLSILLATQGLHSIEHLAQWVQYHVLGWSLKESSGLISPLNAEVIHFTWNWAVALTVGYLLWAGPRTRWMWLLMAWAIAHSSEHTYIFIGYIREVTRLASLGLPIGAAQGLPGFFGQGGWLASQAETSGVFGFICRVAPPLAEAPRLDVHFWWNVGEVSLLLVAAHMAVRKRFGAVAIDRPAAGDEG